MLICVHSGIIINHIVINNRYNIEMNSKHNTKQSNCRSVFTLQ